MYILRLPIEVEKHGLKLKVLLTCLKWRDCILKICMVPLMLIACLKMEGIVKWRGLKSERPLYFLSIFPRCYSKGSQPGSSVTAAHLKQTILEALRSLFGEVRIGYRNNGIVNQHFDTACLCHVYS